jgi:hypothetical protein
VVDFLVSFTASSRCNYNEGKTIHIGNPQDATVYQNFISYLYEAQHVSGDTPPIIRSLKLHWQPLVFHTWKAVGHVVGGRCQARTVPDNVKIKMELPSI